jgi:hypothetical protein
VGPSQRAENM